MLCHGINKNALRHLINNMRDCKVSEVHCMDNYISTMLELNMSQVNRFNVPEYLIILFSLSKKT